MPGRVYEKTGLKKAGYLREDRVGGVPRPRSFSSLDIFLKERRVELGDFLADTTEVERPLDRQVTEEEPMEVDDDEEEDSSDLENGLDDQLGESAEEDISDIDDDE